MGSKVNYLGDIMAVVTEALQTTLQTLNIKLLIWMLLHGLWALGEQLPTSYCKQVVRR
jgi:hypothetical protein